MKKIIKNPIFAFILGAILFSGITGVVAYTILAKDVSYTPNNTKWKVDNVEGALDDLYSKAKPDYTGSTAVTPTTNSQTLVTKDKILKNDITINAIPSTYKNLTTPTTADATNLLSGYTAYNKDGNLITGTLTNGCISQRVTCTSCDTSVGQELTNFWPSQFTIYGVDTTSNQKMVWYYNNRIADDKIYVFSESYNMVTLDSTTIDASYKLNNKLVLRGWNVWKNRTLEYVACK